MKLKKISAVLLVAVMLFSFNACGVKVDLDSKKAKAEEKILEGSTEVKDVIDEGLDKTLDEIDAHSDDIDAATDKIKEKLDKLSGDGFFF